MSVDHLCLASQIKDMKVGEGFIGNYMLKEATAKKSAGAGDFYVLRLGDYSGTFTCVPFGHNAEVDARDVEKPAIYQVKGVIKLYKGTPSVSVESLQLHPQTDIPPEELRKWLEVSSVPLDSLVTELEAHMCKLKPDHKYLVQHLLQSQYPGFNIWPAAASAHHAYVHGLLEHTVRMLRQVGPLAALYNADASVLRAAVILHDAAKTREYVGPGSSAVTMEGTLFGHVYLSAALFRAAATDMVSAQVAATPELDNVDEGRYSGRADLMNIEHCILSHHGKPEWGSCVRPSTLEAVLLHQIDNLDAKACSWMYATKDMQPWSTTAGPVFSLETKATKL